MINECHNQQRKTRPTVSWEDLKEQMPDERDDYSQLYLAIQKLKPRIRITVVLYYVEGYSVREISEILKIPCGTVKSRLSKGRNMLKADLESEG